MPDAIRRSSACCNLDTGTDYLLEVMALCPGVGSITSQPGGIGCSSIPGGGTDCEETYPQGAVVTLIPSAGVGQNYFAGWTGGGGTGTGSCSVTLTAAQSVTATFQTGFALTVSRPSTGAVTRNPAGGNCTTTSGGLIEQCIYAPGAVVKLTPGGTSGASFDSWSGACTGNVVPCVVTMTGNLSVSADFTNVDPVAALINHYYVSILERQPEPGGAEFWQGLVEEKQAAGEDAKDVFRTMAQFFFNSEEYTSRNTTDREFLANLYLTFFQRLPDDAGYAYWLDQLANQGMSRDTAILLFLYTPEFEAFMEATLGI